MADRNREDVRFRLSAEGIEEVRAAFLQVNKEAQQASQGMGNLARRTSSTAQEANEAVQLLSREIGVTLPRSVARYISSLSGVQRAMAAAFNAAIVLAFVAAIVKALPKLAELIDSLNGVNKELFEVEQSIQRMQGNLFAPEDVREASARIAELTTRIRDLKRANDEITGTGFRRSLSQVAPGFLLNPDFKANRDEIRRLQEALAEAEGARIGFAKKAADDANEQQKAIQREIELLNISEAQKIRVQNAQAKALLDEQVQRRNLTQQQRDELAALIDTREELQLKALAASEAEEAARRAFTAARSLANAQRDLEQASAENELAIVRARNKAISDEEEAAFEQGLINVDSFFADRRRALQDESEREIAILRRQAEALAGEISQLESRPLETKELSSERQKQILDLIKERSRLLADIQVKEVQTAGKLAVMEAEYASAIRLASREQLRAEAELLAAQGNRFAAARRQLDAEIAGLERLKGESDKAFGRRPAGLRTVGEAAIRFDELSLSARQALLEVDAERRRIEQQVQSGLLFQFQAQQKLADAEQARIPVLRQIAEQLAAAAAATGDAEKIQQAREFAQAIDEIAIASDRAAQRSAEFKLSIESALTGDLENFFSRGITEAENFSDAMRLMALSVVDSLRRIASQMLTNLAIQQLLGLVGGVSTSLSPTGALPLNTRSAPALLGAASGGLIHGPGTETSDSIPAWLSRGEFVVRAAAVRQPGVLEALRELNDRPQLVSVSSFRRRGFAEGGLVEAPSAASADGRADLFVGFDEGLLVRRLETSGLFQRAVIRIADKNRKAFNNALGHGPK